MEKIKEIVDFVNKHPTKKHDEDHADLWKVIIMICDIIKAIFEKFQEEDKGKAEFYEHEIEVVNVMKELNSRLNDRTKDIAKLWLQMDNLEAHYPKITALKKSALIMDGENVIDTVDLESWRYLMVKSINPVDWNEYAKLEDAFSWEIIEVTDGKYDVKVDLKTTTEGETATMTANVDLLFVKY